MSAETVGQTAPYRDLLAALRDALDIPRPADGADERRFEALQRARAMAAVGAIAAVLVEGFAPEAVTEVLRQLVQESPVTYRPYEPEAQDSPAEVTR